MQIISEIRSGGGPHIHIGLAALLGVAVAPTVPRANADGTGTDCTASMAARGAWVVNVTGNPAAGAGLTPCARITGVGAYSISTSSDLHNAMEQYTVGQTVTLTWLDSSNTSHSATVKLAQAAFPD